MTWPYLHIFGDVFGENIDPWQQIHDNHISEQIIPAQSSFQQKNSCDSNYNDFLLGLIMSSAFMCRGGGHLGPRILSVLKEKNQKINNP